MKKYRKHTASKFGISLREAMKSKFPYTKITSVFLASQYNIRAKNGDSISTETARKWLNGDSLPSLQKYHLLHEWIGIDNSFMNSYDHVNKNMAINNIENTEINFEELSVKLSDSNLFNTHQIEYLHRLFKSVIK